MAGKFEGLTDQEWQVFKNIFPKPPVKKSRGKPRNPARFSLNTIIYVLITGCRWCDVPKGPQWAARSSAHDALKRWTADGTIARLQENILNLAEKKGLISWNEGACDGSFSPWKRRGQ